jgi:hypothetical protein
MSMTLLGIVSVDSVTIDLHSADTREKMGV